MPVKRNLKIHFEDGKLDLSMLALAEVPVKDIVSIINATSSSFVLFVYCLTTLSCKFFVFR